MAYVKIVTNKKGTVVRNIPMVGHSTQAVDNVATTIESLICEERNILHVEVDYEHCDDSRTI